MKSEGFSLIAHQMMQLSKIRNFQDLFPNKTMVQFYETRFRGRILDILTMMIKSSNYGIRKKS